MKRKDELHIPSTSVLRLEKVMKKVPGIHGDD